jgi:hypothetical protein
MRSRVLPTFLLLLAVTNLSTNSAEAVVTAKNNNGSSISIPTQSLSKNTIVTVTGRGFDETVGIYLAFCIVPKQGALPTPCGGGVNKSGADAGSFWISSNPPPYGVGLATEFLPGGRFVQKVAVSRKIGKFDCKKVKCAITVRADHIREGDRSHDIYLPIVFK